MVDLGETGVTPSDTQNLIENSSFSEELRDYPPTYRNTYEKNVFNFFTR